MAKNNGGTGDYYSIDLLHIIKSVWSRAWLVVAASVLAAVIGFCVANFGIAPTYSSSVMFYVNNSLSVSDIDLSISSSDLSASQSLVKTYTVLLKNRTTLDMVIEEAGVDYEWEDVYDMITAAPVDETEVMQITVTCENPYEAQKIANSIAVVLPQRTEEIVKGSSMAVVDSAVVDTAKVAPSITKYTALGFLLGAIAAVIALVIAALLDKTVHDEEYVINTYDCPVLAKIPDLTDVGSKKYGYYKHSNKAVK